MNFPMNRRSSIPWIHYWSRPLIAAIAGLGALTTAYLTVVKLTQGTAACPNEGCDLVLNSDYATVFGQPLSLFGFLAYTSILIFALAPKAINSDEKTELRSNLENWTWSLLLVGAIAMSVFSVYLMYLLAFKIEVVCLYCIASALFSLSLLVLTVIGRDWEDVGQIVFTSIVVGLVVLIGALGVYADLNTTAMAELPLGQTLSLMPSGQPIPGVGWSITTTSGKAEIALARHLNEIGAKEYIAWWCPHCHEQKQLFGKEAYSQTNHIECADGGENSRKDLCQTANISSFPTWEINGKSYEGVKSLEELAQLSGYTGPRSFKNFSGAS